MPAVMGLGLNGTRQRLQRFKHADAGTPEELNEVERLMASVEDFFTDAVRVGWRSLDDGGLDGLRAQMEKTDAERWPRADPACRRLRH